MHEPELVGLVPAAGHARRLGLGGMSKELYPLRTSAGGTRPVTAWLLEALGVAGIERALVVTRPEKPDLIQVLGDGTRWGPRLGYLPVEPTPGVPWTLDAAWPWLRGCAVALGFPDILLDPPDVFLRLRERQRKSGADVLLGLFPSTQPEKCDMVELDDDGRVSDLRVKPGADCGLEHTWLATIWSPRMLELQHDWLRERGSSEGERGRSELCVSDVIRHALHEGLLVETELFETGRFIDIGTSDDLERAQRESVSFGSVSQG